MGRRSITIAPMSDTRRRSQALVKRRHGLFKKAHELSVLCSCDVVVMVFTKDWLRQYSNGDVRALVRRWEGWEGKVETKGVRDFGAGGSKGRAESGEGHVVITRGNVPESSAPALPPCAITSTPTATITATAAATGDSGAAPAPDRDDMGGPRPESPLPRPGSPLKASPPSFSSSSPALEVHTRQSQVPPSQAPLPLPPPPPHEQATISGARAGLVLTRTTTNGSMILSDEPGTYTVGTSAVGRSNSSSSSSSSRTNTTTGTPCSTLSPPTFTTPSTTPPHGHHHHDHQHRYKPLSHSPAPGPARVPIASQAAFPSPPSDRLHHLHQHPQHHPPPHRHRYRHRRTMLPSPHPCTRDHSYEYHPYSYRPSEAFHRDKSPPEPWSSCSPRCVGIEPKRDAGGRCSGCCKSGRREEWWNACGSGEEEEPGDAGWIHCAGGRASAHHHRARVDGPSIPVPLQLPHSSPSTPHSSPHHNPFSPPPPPQPFFTAPAPLRPPSLRPLTDILHTLVLPSPRPYSHRDLPSTWGRGLRG